MTVSATGDFHVGVGACGFEATMMALKIHQRISCRRQIFHFVIIALENSKAQGLKMQLSVSK
jgi:hypothetical protein